MVRVTKKRIARTVATSERWFGFTPTEEQARAIVQWDDEDYFVRELSDDGHLDTAPRDYFSMALIDAVMPGVPPVRDGFISQPLKRWHWPLNGSSDDYAAAFKAAWRKATGKRYYQW